MKKKLVTTTAIFLIGVVCVCLFGFVFLHLPLRPDVDSNDICQPTVLDLWYVESFEGGVGSRVDWFNRRTVLFEKQNKGIFVSVSKMNYEQMCLRLTEGYGFDLISFGYGVGHRILNLLQPYDGELSVFDRLGESGVIDGRQYALPVFAGGYVLAALSSDLAKISNFDSLCQNVFDCASVKKIGKNTINLAAVGCGFGEFNSPLTALALNTHTIVKDSSVLAVDTMFTQYNAYEAFLNGNRATVLLGTQRDFCRLDSRVKNGKLKEVVFEVLKDYTDLVQYISVAKNDNEQKIAAAQSFAEFLVSDASQDSLVGVSMLSVLKTDLYKSGVLCQMQESIANARAPNAFAFEGTQLDLKTTSRDALFDGNTNKIKNYLC